MHSFGTLEIEPANDTEAHLILVFPGLITRLLDFFPGILLSNMQALVELKFREGAPVGHLRFDKDHQTFTAVKKVERSAEAITFDGLGCKVHLGQLI